MWYQTLESKSESRYGNRPQSSVPRKRPVGSAKYTNDKRARLTSARPQSGYPYQNPSMTNLGPRNNKAAADPWVQDAYHMVKKGQKNRKEIGYSQLTTQQSAFQSKPN